MYAALRKMALVLAAVSPLVVASATPTQAHGWHGGGVWAGLGAGLALGAILSATRYGYYYGPYYGYYGPSYYPYAAYYGPVCDIHRRVVFHHGHRHVYRYRVCY